MNIKLPATLTAHYEPDSAPGRWGRSNSGMVHIQFGGCDVLTIRVESDGMKFDEDAEYYAGMAQEELSQFVAELLGRIFTNALAIQ